MAGARGFSMAELLACLVVSAALLGLALPAMSVLVQENRLSNGLHGLTGALASARIAAITQGVPVSVCPSADGRRCRTDLDWSHGWIIYRDPDGRPQAAEVAGAIIFHADRPLPGMSVHSTAGRQRVRFRPDGMAGGGNVTLRLCAGKPRKLRGEVIVSLAGRARVVRHERPGKACPGVRPGQNP